VSANGDRPALTLGVPAELVEAIARRAAELVAERQAVDVDDGWLRGAEAIAAYIGARRDRVYALASAGRIPVHRDGSALLAKRSELDVWVRAGGGKRP
jgi:excisionase family DNA binding protein